MLASLTSPLPILYVRTCTKVQMHVMCNSALQLAYTVLKLLYYCNNAWYFKLDKNIWVCQDALLSSEEVYDSMSPFPSTVFYCCLSGRQSRCAIKLQCSISQFSRRGAYVQNFIVYFYWQSHAKGHIVELLTITKFDFCIKCSIPSPFSMLLHLWKALLRLWSVLGMLMFIPRTFQGL